MTTIICKVNSGMCNRLIPYITSFILSKKLSGRLYVLWDDNCADMDYNYKGKKTQYNDMFEYIDGITFINNNQYNIALNQKNILKITYMNEHLISEKNINDLKKYNIIIFHEYTFPIFIKEDNVIFKSYSDIKWLNNIEKSYFNDFTLLKPKKNIEYKINEVLQLFNDSKNMIGIHIRHWPDNWLNKNSYLLENNENIRINYMKRKINENNNVKFFISSTDIVSINRLINLFGDKIIYLK